MAKNSALKKQPDGSGLGKGQHQVQNGMHGISGSHHPQCGIQQHQRKQTGKMQSWYPWDF